MNEKTLPTPEELRREWIAALRSGEFKQGRVCLRRINDEYCCLGVGMMVLSRHMDVRMKRETPEGKAYEFDGDVTEMPWWARRRFGLSADGQSHLIGMNDGDRVPFAEIADELEKNPSKYFQLEGAP